MDLYSIKKIRQNCKLKAFHVTKLSVLFLIISLTTFANSYSQSATLNLYMRNATIEDVINNIEEQSEFRFLYNKNVVNVEKKVSISAKEEPLTDILEAIFEDTDISYIISEKQIILNKKENPAVMQNPMQSKVVTGTVLDEQGFPVIGANVIEKGTTNGIVTDIDGKFSLKVEDNAVLQISYIGYADQEVQVAGKTTFSISLREDTQLLDEVVVTSLGIKRQVKEIGYSTQKISGDDAVLASAPDVISSLNGKVAGLTVAATDGVDGNSSYLTIRGNNNITGNNQPLFVIDGVPVTNDFYATGGKGTGINEDGRDWGNPMNNINPYDIESMNVMKGPAAAALYGARGGNGAIIITTKKGRASKGIGISYSYRHKIIDPYLFRDVQNTFGGGAPVVGNDIIGAELPKNDDGQYTLTNKFAGLTLTGHNPWVNFGWYPTSISWGPKMEGQDVVWWDGEVRPFSPQPNNQELFVRPGSNNEHNIAFSGAGDLGSVRVSITNVSNEAITYNSGFNQTTINIGSRLNVSDKVNADISVSYMDYKRKNAPVLGQDDNSVGKTLLYVYAREYKGLDKQIYENPDGTRNTITDKLGANSYAYNYFTSYWWKTYHNNQYLDRRRLLGSMSLNYEATNWLNLTARAGLDTYDDDWTLKNDPTKIDGIEGGKYERELKQDVLKTFDILAVIHKDNLINNLNARLTFGGSYWYRQKYALKGSNGSKWSFPDGFSFVNVSDTEKNELNEYFYKKQINSAYGILNLSYRDYLFLELTGRNDISSTLPTSNNSYFYPSANLSFIFTEAFDLSRDWLNFGKARLAFAQTASDADPFQVDPTFLADKSIGGIKYYRLPDEVPPLGLKPQKANSYEGGVILGLFNNKINFDFTYYYIKSFNQILSAPLPVSSGATKYMFNTGELENKGIEVVINAEVLRRRDFSWNVDLNFAKNSNKVLELDENADVIKLSEIGGYGAYAPFVKAQAGEQYGTIYGYAIERTSDGRKIVSDDGRHYITTDEMVPLGNATPDFTVSMLNTVRYKNFTFGVNVDAKVGGDVFAGTYATSLITGQAPETLHERLGNGLPLVGSDGKTYNNGVILEGVRWDGSGYKENDVVVHAWYKYINKGSAWGDHGGVPYKGEDTAQRPVHETCVIDNSWVKLRNVSLTYSIPANIVNKTKVFQSINLSFVGRDLFYIYKNMPDNINPEGLANAGNGYGLEWGALPATRSFTFGINASF